jgi:hypothetical protein
VLPTYFLRIIVLSGRLLFRKDSEGFGLYLLTHLIKISLSFLEYPLLTLPRSITMQEL